MALEKYRERRNFKATPEPSGSKARPRSRRAPMFVVQKHAASRLHYDFRLEIEGVLVSWAVPKGPSLNPSDKRLAMLTEDHPLEYGDFEGVIPEGHYGVGTVMVWDHGTFEIEGETSASKQYAAGELKFLLHGGKLGGSFVLVRGDHRRWFLIKRRDASADKNWNIADYDYSAKTGRSMDEISKQNGHLVSHRR
jgi:bifunctional non-homologous end joining protein LigD